VEGGSAAEAVNIYKKLSTGTGLEADRSNSREMEPTSRLKDNFPINPAVQDYGTKVAEIYDWGILDEFGNTTTVISSESPTKIILRIRFLQSCTNPIVGYFFTDVQGREIVGTNTLFSKSPLSSRSSGECLEVTFKQSLLLTSGEYSLNLGCSEYRNDELVSHHRLYDVCMFSVLQLHQNVGFYLPPTDVEINELV
jgi:teichoic acid transport system ATP-binding protein